MLNFHLKLAKVQRGNLVKNLSKAEAAGDIQEGERILAILALDCKRFGNSYKYWKGEITMIILMIRGMSVVKTGQGDWNRLVVWIWRLSNEVTDSEQRVFSCDITRPYTA